MKSQQEWKMTPLGIAADIVMGQSPDSKFYSIEEVGLPFLQGCAEFGNRFPRHKLFCSQNRKLASAESILFSVRAPVGKLNIADQSYVIGRGLASISGTVVATRYLEHFLQFEEGRLRVASQGSTFEAINSTELAQWPVVHPKDQHEQNKIAEILSTVDQAIDQTEALIAKQQRIKTGLMQDLLTCGIDEDFPQEWKTTPLGIAADIVMGQSPDSKFYSTEEVGLPFLQGCAEFGNRFPRHKLFCSQNRKLASAGSILFSVRAPVGKLNIADQSYVIGRGLASISGTVVATRYLEHFLQFEEGRLRVASQGSTFEAINSTELAQWPVVHPKNQHEQIKVAEILSTVDLTIEHTKALMAKQQLIKISLMQDLLTCKVRVTPLLTEVEVRS